MGRRWWRTRTSVRACVRWQHEDAEGGGRRTPNSGGRRLASASAPACSFQGAAGADTYACRCLLKIVQSDPRDTTNATMNHLIPFANAARADLLPLRTPCDAPRRMVDVEWWRGHGSCCCGGGFSDLDRRGRLHRPRLRLPEAVRSFDRLL